MCSSEIGMDMPAAPDVYIAGAVLTRPRRFGIGSRIVAIDPAGDELIKDRERIGPTVTSLEELALAACRFGLHQVLDHDEFESVKNVVIHTDCLYITENVPAAMFTSPQQKMPRVYSGASKSTMSLWQELVKDVHRTKRDFKWIPDISVNPHFAAAFRAPARPFEVGS